MSVKQFLSSLDHYHRTKLKEYTESSDKDTFIQDCNGACYYYIKYIRSDEKEIAKIKNIAIYPIIALIIMVLINDPVDL